MQPGAPGESSRVITAAAAADLSHVSYTPADVRFMQGMIKHHGGALTMVEQLFSTPGSGQEVEVFMFASDVDADQRIEMDRMAAMLDGVLKELQR